MEAERGLKINRVFFGEARYRRGGHWGPRIQQDFQLVLLHEGSVDISIDGAPHRLEQNEVCLLFPGHEEYFHFSREAESIHTWCALTCDGLASPYGRLLEGLPFKTSISTRMKQMVLSAIALGYMDDPVLNLMRMRMAEVVLLDFIRCAQGNVDLQLPKAMPVYRVQRYIELHFDESLDLVRLGAIAHMSPAHLTRVFKKQVGCTPIKYLWDTRLRRAVQLLTDTGLSISEIAWRTGFKTAAHFSRAVKDRHGVTPRKLRLRAWHGLSRQRDGVESSDSD